METIIEFCLSGAITLLGLFMFIFPNKNLKPEMKSTKENISKIRRNGLILTLIGVAVIVVLILAQSQLK